MDYVTEVVNNFAVPSHSAAFAIVFHVLSDEYGHRDRSMADELAREDFIKNKGYSIIRYNPNEPEFDLSDVLNRINRRLMMLL
jgi:very-short-patch-repair endonuclease